MGSTRLILDLSFETPTGVECGFRHEVTEATVREFALLFQSHFDSSRSLDFRKFSALLEDERTGRASDAEAFLASGYRGWAVTRFVSAG